MGELILFCPCDQRQASGGRGSDTKNGRCGYSGGYVHARLYFRETHHLHGDDQGEALRLLLVAQEAQVTDGLA